MTTSSSHERCAAALNLVGKWRALFTGWQLGTRPKGDPESDAVSDHREATILLRVEVTALTRILLQRGLITADELHDALEAEALELAEAFAERFPGIRAVPGGLQFDSRAAETMRGWRQ